MVVRCEFYDLMAKTIFIVLLFLPREHRIHIFLQPYNILHVCNHLFFFTIFLTKMVIGQKQKYW